MNKPTIAVDFDGVLYARSSKDFGNMTFEGEPVPGAMNFLRHLIKPFTVIIFSARFAADNADECIQECKTWLLQHMYQDSENAARRGKPRYDHGEVVAQLQFTAVKPMARIFLDDRAICFDGVFPTIPSLLAFKTWDKR